MFFTIKLLSGKPYIYKMRSTRKKPGGHEQTYVGSLDDVQTAIARYHENKEAINGS